MKLSENLEPGRSPESQMAEHQVKIAMTSVSCMIKKVHSCDLLVSGQACVQDSRLIFFFLLYQFLQSKQDPKRLVPASGRDLGRGKRKF